MPRFPHRRTIADNLLDALVEPLLGDLLTACFCRREHENPLLVTVQPPKNQAGPPTPKDIGVRRPAAIASGTTMRKYAIIATIPAA
jgi:hypothetical protein